ncbi:zwei Ig domain protein zig-8-like [Palaemon carinicauda]|uniref:zwei Ig domain protein zig-8-like n=1 Tax=Palaemon carinicauda TaxID=392227 RepID=UPI0035B5DB32
MDSTVNVTVNEGSHAFLPCRVANLGDRSVTWMRRKNLHIITAGMLTYSPDDRYRVLHPSNTDEWTLHIKFTQPGDGGWYECQVNSDPKITRPVLLLVKDKNLDDPFYKHDFEIENNSEYIIWNTQVPHLYSLTRCGVTPSEKVTLHMVYRTQKQKEPRR